MPFAAGDRQVRGLEEAVPTFQIREVFLSGDIEVMLVGMVAANRNLAFEGALYRVCNAVYRHLSAAAYAGAFTL